MNYPKHKYAKGLKAGEFDTKIVNNEAEEKALGKDYVDSPAEFGIVTCPNSEEELLKPETKGKKA